MKQPLLPGDTAPWFRGRAVGGNPNYAFHTAGGRVILMLFAGTATQPEVAAAIADLAKVRDRLDDKRAAFFGVSVDPADVTESRIAQDLPGIRWFMDADRAISTAYGAVDGQNYRPHWLLLDPALRVVAMAGVDRTAHIFDALDALLAEQESLDVPAPVLLVPRIFEPAMCHRLVKLWNDGEQEDSGFMREVNGVTTGLVDYSLKRRSDVSVTDDALQNALRARIMRFLLPAVERAFQYQATRIERYIVARYDATGGYFGPHRDNTTKGTAHRRFACTINLNAGDYDGGDLRFPEFGAKTYRAPTGGAVVFSCSLLHEATPVTRGERYAFLPFFYDEAGAKLREANLEHVEPAFRI
jgi:predicted 2-oxoglutarate/Fe(II)-dependent dioxygenase YbiX/peroxiredoxin